MANSLTPFIHLITARGLMALRDQIPIVAAVNSSYDEEARMPGETINIPVPRRSSAVAVTPGPNAPANRDRTSDLVPLTLDQHWEDYYHITDKERGQVMGNASYIPSQTSASIQALGEKINEVIYATYTGIYGYVGTAGTTPFGSGVEVASAVDVRKTLKKQRCPMDRNLRMILDPDAEAKATTLRAFHDASFVNDAETMRSGNIGQRFGFTFMGSNAVPTHTAGSITTGLAAKASTAQAVGLTTIVATTAASTGACALVEGDIITIGSDPQTYVLTAAATQASAAADVNLSISPSLQVALTGGEAIAVKASHVVNLGFHRDAIAFATRRTPSPLAQALVAEIYDPVSGVVLQTEIVRGHAQDTIYHRVLFGVSLVRAELACRLAG